MGYLGTKGVQIGNATAKTAKSAKTERTKCE